MKQVALSILFVISLTSCVHKDKEKKCGAFVDKWREGQYNERGVIAVNCDGAIYSASVNDAVYASAKEGDWICIEGVWW